MAILSFSFKAFDQSRDKVLEELDGMVRDILIEVKGEPWVVVTDKIQKVPFAGGAKDLTDPTAFIYMAEQEVVFMGPSPVGPAGPGFREGFMPQGGTDLEF